MLRPRLRVAVLAVALLGLALAAHATIDSGGKTFSWAGHTFVYGGHISYVKVPMQFKIQHGGTGNTDHISDQRGQSYCGTAGVIWFTGCADDSQPFSPAPYSHHLRPMVLKNGSIVSEDTSDRACDHYGNGEMNKRKGTTLEYSQSMPGTAKFDYKIKWYDDAGEARDSIIIPLDGM